MKIRYSDSTNELEIEPYRDELLNLSKKLLEDDAEIIAVVEEDFKAAPYSRFLFGIKVKVLPGELVKFQVTQDGKLLIEGDRQKLSILSDVFLSLVEDCTIGEHKTYKHIHIDYYSEHPYLSSSSISVVLMYA